MDFLVKFLYQKDRLRKCTHQKRPQIEFSNKKHFMGIFWIEFSLECLFNKYKLSASKDVTNPFRYYVTLWRAKRTNEQKRDSRRVFVRRGELQTMLSDVKILTESCGFLFKKGTSDDMESIWIALRNIKQENSISYLNSTFREIQLCSQLTTSRPWHIIFLVKFFF